MKNRVAAATEAHRGADVALGVHLCVSSGHQSLLEWDLRGWSGTVVLGKWQRDPVKEGAVRAGGDVSEAELRKLGHFQGL